MKKLFWILCLVLFPFMATAQGTLVLIIDKSESISDQNVLLIRDSYQKALSDLSIMSGINVEVILFSTYAQYIGSGRADKIVLNFDTYVGMDTCLETALALALKDFDTYPKPVVIDITGDGQPNCVQSNAIPTLLDRLALKGAIINTLYVGRNIPNQVTNIAKMTRGHGSFSRVVSEYSEFEEALFEKLATEIAFLN